MSTELKHSYVDLLSLQECHDRFIQELFEGVRCVHGTVDDDPPYILRGIPLVYVLNRADPEGLEPVYIGKSDGAFPGRLAVHRQTKEFSVWQAFLLSSESLERIERDLIMTHRPELNVAHNPDRCPQIAKLVRLADSIGAELWYRDARIKSNTEQDHGVSGHPAKRAKLERKCGELNITVRYQAGTVTA